MHLRTLRLRLGWTQKDLYKRSKIPQNTISRIERNSAARPSIMTVAALAKALGVDPLSIQFGLPKAKAPRRTPADARVPA